MDGKSNTAEKTRVSVVSKLLGFFLDQTCKNMQSAHSNQGSTLSSELQM
jgi:hypothetical protein